MIRLLSKNYRLLLILFLALSQTNAKAQNVIQGRVQDQAGLSMPGVSVQIKGSQISTATDLNGDFRISSPDAAPTLVFAFLGFETAELVGDTKQPMLVLLKESNESLEEVVVVGYGTQKKVNLTGSVSVLDGEDLAKRQVSSTSLALQGAAPGVTIRQQSGVPGGDGGSINIRGIGSINAGQNPLILVDNVEMSLDAVDPNNIESISVLKDAAASAVYGSRAANGVILVTTKRGSEGVAVSYNGYMSHQAPVDLPKKVNAVDHMRLWDVAQVNGGLPPAFTDQIAAYETLGPDNFTRFDTDWEDLVLTNNGLMHNHNLNIA